MKVAIADDHEIVRLGLKMLLETLPGFDVVIESDSGTHLLDELQRQDLDLVILDQFMPDGNGLDFLRNMSSLPKVPKVIFLTGVSSAAILREAKALGADAIVAKKGSGAELLAAIAAVQQGKFYSSPDLIPRVEKGDLLSTLTPREMEVLLKITEGHSTKMLAEQLGVSFKTADTHRSRVMSKLELHSIVELMEFAREWELIADK